MNEEQTISRVHGILLSYGIEEESDLYMLSLVCYTDTTKCSLSVDPGRVLWSLMEHLLTEVEAYMCQHLPDLYAAPAICEDKKTTIQLTHEQTADPKPRSGASPGGENNDICRHTAEEQTEAQGGHGAPRWSYQGLDTNPGGSASTLLFPSPPGV